MTMSNAPVVDLNGQWVEDAFQHLDNANYRRRLYRFLRKHGYHTILRIIMATVEIKRSQTMTERMKDPKNHPMYGKHHSEETKAKMSAAWTPGKRTKQSYAMTGEKSPSKRPEVRAKLSASMTGKNNPMYGKTHSKETRAKISVAYTPKRKAKQSAHMTGENNPAKQSVVRAKISAYRIGKHHSEETKAKMSADRKGENGSFFGKHHSEETKAQLSAANTGKNHPFFGKHLTVEHKAKISKAQIGEKNHMYGKIGMDNPMNLPGVRTKHSAAMKRPEVRAKLSETSKGENNPSWQGGISFEPYCPRFNNQLKEKIRNRDNRICVACGKGEIQNGQRLSVHHIDSDKMQGCNGKPWYLCALCRSCNSKADTIEKEFLIVSNLQTLKIER